MIHTDSIGTERIHERGVKLALGGVGERVIGGQLVCNSYDQLVVHPYRVGRLK
jgi:hypothetical protein